MELGNTMTATRPGQASWPILTGAGVHGGVAADPRSGRNRPRSELAKPSRATSAKSMNVACNIWSHRKPNRATGKGGQQGPGITGMALMVLLASGEDPNFGLYANSVRRALRSIIGQQSASTGIMGKSMYHHGFATLALAEAYGTVDDRNLWTGTETNRRTIGQALELAVRAPDGAKQESSRRLAVFARQSRRGHFGQRRGASRTAGRTQRRHRDS